MGSPGSLVLVADDEADVRRAVTRSLAGHCRTVAVDALEAILPAVGRHRPAVVMLDWYWHPHDVLGVLRQLGAEHPEVRVCMYSGFGSPANVVASIRAGARGFLVKPATVAELRAAVRSVARGELVVSPEVRALILVDGTVPGRVPPSALTVYQPGTREFAMRSKWITYDLDVTLRAAEVLLCVHNGWLHKQIATHLELSKRTVDHWFDELYQTMRSSGATTPAGLARLVSESLHRMPKGWEPSDGVVWGRGGHNRPR